MVRLEIEGDDLHKLFGNAKTVYHGITDVLLFHALHHISHNMFATGVLGEQLIYGSALTQQLFGIFRPFGGMNSLFGFRIVYQFAVYQALAVAHQP